MTLLTQIAAMLDGRLAAIMDASMPSEEPDKKRKKKEKKRSEDGEGDALHDDPNHPASLTSTGSPPLESRGQDKAADDSLAGLRFFKRVPKGALITLPSGMLGGGGLLL